MVSQVDHAPPQQDDATTDGARLLDQVYEALKTYIIFPTEENAVAVTLWIAATHAQAAWEHAPRLAAVSPLKRCGKSRLMDIVEMLVHHPLITVNISPAALVRSISANDPPTIMLDEADTVFGKAKVADQHEDLRGLLNAGHQRNRPYIRWDMIKREPEACATFSMAMLAGIGDLPDTIMDRSIVIRMRRRAPGESVRPYRTRRDQPRLARLREELHTWVFARVRQLGQLEPPMPVEDRAADTWTPLVAIADAAGGDWPEKARNAVTVMAAEAVSDENSLATRLLDDLRTVFGDDKEALHTSTILEALHKIEDGPWAEFYGHAFNANDLSKRLRDYGVRPVDVREGGVNRKGYKRAHLADAWRRYLEVEGGEPAAVNGHDVVGQLDFEEPPTLTWDEPAPALNGHAISESVFDWSDVDSALDEPWDDADG